MTIIKIISNNTNMRSDHNTTSSVIGVAQASAFCEGIENFTPTADVYNASNVLINKAGDRWLKVTKKDGVALSTPAWVAITHKGYPIAQLISETPVDDNSDPYVKAILFRASGAQELWYPEDVQS